MKVMPDHPVPARSIQGYFMPPTFNVSSHLSVRPPRSLWQAWVCWVGHLDALHAAARPGTQLPWYCSKRDGQMSWTRVMQMGTWTMRPCSTDVLSMMLQAQGQSHSFLLEERRAR